jgi:hypothetical protein
MCDRWALFHLFCFVPFYLGTNEKKLVYCQKTYEDTSARNIESLFYGFL